MNAWFYFALVLLIVNLVVMFVLYLRMKDRFSQTRILGDIRTEIDRLILDLGRETDRDVAILEDRIRGLRELMDEADRRILLANREDTKRRNLPEIPLQKETATEKKYAVTEQTIKENEPALPPQNNDPADIKQPVAEDNEPVIIYTKPRITRRENQLEPEIPVRERVVEMARKDISPEIIAKTIGISQGEVDLILAMNESSL